MLLHNRLFHGQVRFISISFLPDSMTGCVGFEKYQKVIFWVTRQTGKTDKFKFGAWKLQSKSYITLKVKWNAHFISIFVIYVVGQFRPGGVRIKLLKFCNGFGLNIFAYEKNLRYKCTHMYVDVWQIMGQTRVFLKHWQSKLKNSVLLLHFNDIRSLFKV